MTNAVYIVLSGHLKGIRNDKRENREFINNFRHYYEYLHHSYESLTDKQTTTTKCWKNMMYTVDNQNDFKSKYDYNQEGKKYVTSLDMKIDEYVNQNKLQPINIYTGELNHYDEGHEYYYIAGDDFGELEFDLIQPENKKYVISETAC